MIGITLVHRVPGLLPRVRGPSSLARWHWPLTHVEQRRSCRFKGKGYFLNGVEGNVPLLPFDAAKIGLGKSGAQGNLFLRDIKLCPANTHIAGENLTKRKRGGLVHYGS
jgi:hypothetical protein